jgi:uncharacterized protein (DUF1778 family)
MAATARTHSITFRLAENEYQELVSAASTCGAKSISEFSRAAVLNKMSAEHLSNFFEEEVNALVGRLEAFDAKLRDARRRVRQLADHAGISRI